MKKLASVVLASAMAVVPFAAGLAATFTPGEYEASAQGFGGAVTYKGAKRAAKVLAAIPHERALLETDCPYMAPEPVRGTRNDSRNIAHVAAHIGTIWDMDAQAVLDQTAQNARACFGV